MRHYRVAPTFLGGVERQVGLVEKVLALTLCIGLET